MSPAEVVWRLEDRLSLAFLEARSVRSLPELPALPGGFLAAWQKASDALVPDREAIAREFPGESERLVRSADALLAGRVPLFAHTYEFGPDPARWPWNQSPDGGPDVPLEFGPTLDYRNPARAGNTRLLWELGRHHYTADLAQAAYLTGDERYARGVFAILEGFSAACPPYRGIQWVSALEFALRAFSWGWALALVARTPFSVHVEEKRWERLFAAWVAQIDFVRAHESRFSSANNHRLGEAAGLFWSGSLLPFVREAEAWKARGLEALESGFLAQTTPGGVTREHAFAYQHFVLDFVVVAEALSRRQGRAVPGPVRERIERVADGLEILTPGGRGIWPVGDGDEGRALHLGEPWEERVGASLECAARLTGRVWNGERHPRAAWLGGILADPATAPGAPVAPVSSRNGDREIAGYAIVSWPAAAGEARLLFDCAPLGLPPLYAHGHADALMILLDVAGPRLVDPGTGAYHSHPDLRERLRATAAHNTVEVDGRSQSAPGGLFQWKKAARIVSGGICRLHEDGAIEAGHDGYATPGDPLVHRRVFAIHEPDTIVVVDHLEGTSRHRAVVRWHVGDGVPSDRPGRPGHARIVWPDGFEMGIAGFGPDAAVLRTAQATQWAPRFLEPRPCGRVELEALAQFPITFVSVLTLGEADVMRDVDAEGWSVRVTTRAGTSNWRIRTEAGADRRLTRIP